MFRVCGRGVGKDGRGNSKADWNPLDGSQQDENKDGVWQVDVWLARQRMKSLLAGFKHGAAVPASCGCSSDACRSVWQSSSCSSVYVCCRDTKTVKKKKKHRGRERGGGVNVSDRVKRCCKNHTFPCTHLKPCTHTHKWPNAASALSHIRSHAGYFFFKSRFNHNLKHSTLAWIPQLREWVALLDFITLCTNERQLDGEYGTTISYMYPSTRPNVTRQDRRHRSLQTH